MAQGLVANGNIAPSRIVKLDPSSPGKCLQAAAATDKPFGVCQAGQHNAPLAGFQDGFAGVAGLDVNVFTPPDLCMCESGGAVNPGDPITSDSGGRGVTASAGNHCVGFAEQGTTGAGQLFRIKVATFTY